MKYLILCLVAICCLGAATCPPPNPTPIPPPPSPSPCFNPDIYQPSLCVDEDHTTYILRAMITPDGVRIEQILDIVTVSNYCAFLDIDSMRKLMVTPPYEGWEVEYYARCDDSDGTVVVQSDPIRLSDPPYTGENPCAQCPN